MKKVAAILLAGIILAGCAAVAAAGTDQTLVPLSYFTGTYYPDVVKQAETRVETATEKVYQTALAALNAKHSANLGQTGGTGSASGSLTDQRMKRGDAITLNTGAGVMLLAGQAVVSYSSGAVVDVTAGQTAASGTALSVNHR